MKFNSAVHCQDEHGDPLRNEDGTIRLKPNWKEQARDHMGRAFNPKIHGDKPELDDDGNLKMARRDSLRKPMTASNRTEDFVSKYRENGYTYRLVNDEGGRVEKFKAHDWEPVMDRDGVATMSVGQARAPGTKAILMKKPQEWYDEDQKAKDRLLNANLERNSKPKVEEGQYDAGGLKESRLR